MEKRYAKGLVKSISETDGLLTGAVGSTATVDRYGESIDQKSWILDEFKKNPVILWAHNLTMGEDRPPIGRAVNVEVKGSKLLFDIQFDMADPFAADIFRKYKEKFLNAFSVGFISHKVQESDGEEAPILMDNELLELSAVPVPANPEALQALKSRSFSVRSFKSMIDEVETKDVLETKKVEKHSKKEITPDNSKTEIRGGSPKDESQHKDDPKNKSLQSKRKLIAVIREATRQFQQVLHEDNVAHRSDK